jgi:hypothetical protein
MVETLLSQDLDVIYGSKTHVDSRVKMSRIRKLMSVVFRGLIILLFRFDITDSQCGVKVYRRDLIDTVLRDMKERGFLFDLELFVLSKKYGFTKFQDFPINLHREGTTSVGIGSIVSMFVGAVRVHLHNYFLLTPAKQQQSK